jgi:uncharacterized protein YbjT (DUF2867 family)
LILNNLRSIQQKFSKMKIIITGSLGHISKPLTIDLVEKGHHVTVISRKPENQKEIEILGATAAIGLVDDVEFLTATFSGADVVYCMIPPNFAELNQVAYYSRIGSNYAQAIVQSGVRRVIELSSYGAHLEKGTGFIVGSNRVEKIFDALEGVATTHIRPGYFYYNFFNFLKMVKFAGLMSANYGGEDKLAMVSPIDIATAVADEIAQPLSGSKVVYVASDDRTCNDIASILGEAVGKPDLKWLTLTSEQMQNGLESNGVPSHIAFNLVELGEATHRGALREEYDLHPPEMGKIKLTDFAKEFAAAYKA